METVKFSGTSCICSLERRRKCHACLLKVHQSLNILKLYFISVYSCNAISGTKNYTFWKMDNKTDFLTHFERLQSIFRKKLSVHWHRHKQIWRKLHTSSSSSCSWKVRRIYCSVILKMKLVPPFFPRKSYVPSSFWLILKCLFWYSTCVHPLYLL